MDMDKRWYVVHAHSGFEKRVQVALRERIAHSRMADYFGEILVPTEEVVEMREGSRRSSERKFFPGYVLVEMKMTDDTWHLVKDTPRVMGFIGGKSDMPTPLSEKETIRIRQRMSADHESPRPKTMFEPGEMVRVVGGPFTDFNGVVEEADYEKNRLKISMLILGRSTPVDLEFGQVEKA